MNSVEIVRSWKDEEYRSGLIADERELLPRDPAGSIELSDDQLMNVGGGTPISPLLSLILISIQYCTEGSRC